MVLANQLIYLIKVKIMRKIFSNYVCFSKSTNFNLFCKNQRFLTFSAELFGILIELQGVS